MLSGLSKKARLFRAMFSGHPMWCAWQVTYRCNFRCRFCHYWHDEMGLQGEPALSDYAEGSRKLASYGTLLVSLAGGEPMLRTDLCDIVRAVGEYHFPFVTTNGWFVTEQSAADLMRAGVWGVSVSIDYDNPDQHDRKRGMSGAWKQAWRAVELLGRARVWPWQRVNVIAILMEDNIDQMEALVKMAAERNAYFMIQPYGHLKTGSMSHAHNDGAVSSRLMELHGRYRNFLSNKFFLGRFDQYLSGGGIPGCKAGRAFFNIDSTGDIAICVERRHQPVANLYRDSQQAIRRRLREASKDNTCTSCWYNCRGEVENLYSPWGLFQSLPTYIFDRGQAAGKMGRWA